MADVLVLFASKGDEKAYKQVLEALDKNKVSYDFRVASAHKTPEDVEHILKKKYRVVIAGAGLAAALPGVVAAKVLCPVIGVPCSGNLGGLDALLSIMQIPPGVPVLCTGVDNGKEAAGAAAQMLKGYDKAVLVGGENAAMGKAEEVLRKFDVPCTKGKAMDASALNLAFIPTAHLPKKEDGFAIYCPVAEKEEDAPELALALLKNSSRGLWVGLNNGTNAAIGAVEILNIGGKYTGKLIAYRKEQVEKVRAYSK